MSNINQTSIPGLQGVDHVHVYVEDRDKASEWYENILGFKVVEKLRLWAEDPGGPLTLADQNDSVHLALFTKKYHSAQATTASLAFNVDAQQFMQWHEYLLQMNLQVRLADHDVAWSLYIHDPDNNLYEFTSYEHKEIKNRLDNR